VLLGVGSLIAGWRLLRPVLGHIRKEAPNPTS
jgi:hypothetical protein